jgi:hypothetical protein
MFSVWRTAEAVLETALKWKILPLRGVVVLDVVMACQWTQGSRVQPRPCAVDFKGDRNPPNAFFEGKVKPSAPCCKILRHVMNSFQE